MTISTLPTPPSRINSPADFEAKADAFLGALPAFATEANALAGELDTKLAAATTQANALAGELDTKLAAATTQAGNAADSAAASAIIAGSAADSADASAASAAAAAGSAVAADASVTAAQAAAAAAAAGAGLPSLSGKAGLTLKVLPEETGVGWFTSGVMPRRTLTENGSISAADVGGLVQVSGAFTLSFLECTTLGDGFYCFLKNTGEGDVYLDPNGGETIDGVAGYVLYPGECRLIQCDGATLTSIALSGGHKVFTTSGTFYVPPGISALSVVAIGGGGGGGGGDSAHCHTEAITTAVGGGGGGSGAGVKTTIPLLTSQWGTMLTATVGAGGTGGAAVKPATNNKTIGGVGGNGGTTSLGSLISAGGGTGASTNGGAGGSLTRGAPWASITDQQLTFAPESSVLTNIVAAPSFYPSGVSPCLTEPYNARPTRCSSAGASGAGYICSDTHTYVVTLNAGQGSGTINVVEGDASGTSSYLVYSISRRGGAGSTGAGYEGHFVPPISHGNVNVAGVAGANATGYGSGGDGGTGIVNTSTPAASGKGGNGSSGLLLIWWEA